MIEMREFDNGDVRIRVAIEGAGRAIVMLPGLGRPTEDFDQMVARLTAGGISCVKPETRGIRGSVGELAGISLIDLADDVGRVIEQLGLGPIVVVGHAYGNRVARVLAATRPKLVKAVVCLAAGGLIPPSSEIQQALRRCYDLTLPLEQRINDVQMVMFAPGNPVTGFVDGWHPEVAKAQLTAAASLPIAAWWGGGTAPLLVVQGLQDLIARPQNGRSLRDEFSQRVTLIEIDSAGHALILERTAQVADAILNFVS